MSVAVDVSLNDVRAALSRARIADIASGVLRAERVSNALISIALVSPRAIAALNAAHIGHRGPTDVISFGFARTAQSDPVIGDIYICPSVARDNAARHGVPVREELTRLVVHGMLHVLGYDHPDGDGREDSAMWRRQELILRRVARGAERRPKRRATPRRAPRIAE